MERALLDVVAVIERQSTPTRSSNCRQNGLTRLHISTSRSTLKYRCIHSSVTQTGLILFFDVLRTRYWSSVLLETSFIYGVSILSLSRCPQSLLYYSTLDAQRTKYPWMSFSFLRTQKPAVHCKILTLLHETRSPCFIEIVSRMSTDFRDLNAYRWPCPEKVPYPSYTIQRTPTFCESREKRETSECVLQ